MRCRIGAFISSHLYQIDCNLAGQVCSGSINTDDLIPELISANGTEFKLLQFNNPNSGILTPAFSVSGHRFADIYEYDNGRFDNFDFAKNANLPDDIEFNYILTTEAQLNVPQHNHSFHSPAAYEPTEDYDSIQVPVDILGGFELGQQLKVTVFNQANGLDVNLGVQCAGRMIQVFDLLSEPYEVITPGVFTFYNNPRDSLITDSITGDKIMIFSLAVNDSWIEGGVVPTSLQCEYNRIIMGRLAGTPSENLTYSIVVEEFNPVSTQPILNSAETVCNNNYCIRLLGSNFDTDSSVDVRENIAGSSVIAQFSGNDIYSRSPYQGFDKIQFPIQNLTLQKKLSSSGLCFKVINNNGSSNEQCVTRPVTAPQPAFMGKTVERYKPRGVNKQDIEHTSYTVTGNDGNGGGHKLKIMGNSWKRIASDYTVTSSTYLKVDFRSTQQIPEINGIGFIMNGSEDLSDARSWQFQGTQTYGNQSFNNYSSDDWMTYRIPVGQTFTGQISNIVFIADEDTHVGQSVTFRNPELYENIDAYDDVPAQRAFDDDVREQPVYWNGDGSGTEEQFHNFHDSGDSDWTIMTTTDTRVIRTEMIGNNSDTKMSVYKWISADVHPSGDGRFINVVDQLVESDNGIGNSSITVSPNVLTAYAIKIESRTGQSGFGTDYKLIVETPMFEVPDSYDDVPAQRAYDDDVREQPVYWNGDGSGTEEQFHNFHDSGDSDWTIMTTTDTRVIRTEMIGNNSDTKMSVYKWISADVHPSGDGRFINVVDQLVESDNGIGNSSITVSPNVLTAYAIKIESRTGQSGFGTDYKLIVESQ